MPVQRRLLEVGVVDAGKLELDGEWSFLNVAIGGFRQPASGSFRVWHARRHLEMLAGLLLRDVLRQRWRLVFTTASGRNPGWLTRLLISRVDAVVAASRLAAEQRAPNALVIHHGVDCDLFCPIEESSGKGPERMYPGKRLIGYLGRIRPEKGTDTFVDAMIRVLPRYPDCIAVLAGSCRPEHRKFKSMMESRIQAANLEDRIIFMGHKERHGLVELYQQLELLVAPSRHEGFGLAPLEAMACGTPVIVTRTGAWPELIDEEVGAFIEAGDCKSLEEQVERMLSDPARTREMGRTARRRAVDRHSVAVEAEALVALYKRLIGAELARQESSGI